MRMDSKLLSVCVLKVVESVFDGESDAPSLVNLRVHANNGVFRAQFGCEFGVKIKVWVSRA